jgi:hypothetical protein
MSRRLKSLSRLVAVQRQLHHAEEARLAVLKRDEAGVDHEKRALIAALNGDDALRGLFLDAAVRRMKALTEKGDALRRAREAQVREVLRHGARLKQAERMLAVARQQARRDGEKAALSEVIEEIAARTASLPQA